MTTSAADELALALIRALATTIDSVDGALEVTEAPTASGDGWRVTGAVSGMRRGSIEAWIDLGSAETLARRVTGVETPDEAVILTLVRDLWTRAGKNLTSQPGVEGLSFSFGSARAAGSPARAVACELTSNDMQGQAAVGIELAAGAADGRENLDVVLDIDLPLVVRFARTHLPIRTLAGLGPGSVVDMERAPDEPVQILVGERVIAHGEVVVVGGNYGVRITEVVRPSERIRLEA
ncbi:MAG: FliM/FliN family flagellar motor switch protein [Vicinamibacterales bacterium]